MTSPGSGRRIGGLRAPAVELDGRRRHGREEEVGAMRARGGRSAREERGSGKRRRQRERWGIDRLGFGLGGPRGWAGLELGGPAGPAGGLSLLSPLFLWQKRNREKEKKERVRERICACEQFSRTHKNALDPGKIEVA